MLKFIALAAVAASIGIATETFAQGRDRVNGGYCPAGTCAKNGGRYAANTKNCSAANCSKPTQAKQKLSKKPR
ncbi:MAG: hypothetical protein IT424_14230 [Pirellulales bacterium]|nr:hypothetical protein [Pirellulales bacterium]